MQDDCDPKKAARAPWDVAIDQQAGQLRQIEGTGEVLSLWRSESAGSNPISPTPLCPPEPMAQEGNVSPRPDQGTHLLALNGRCGRRIRKGSGETRRYLRGDPGSIVRAGVALHANGWRYPLSRGGWDPDP